MKERKRERTRSQRGGHKAEESDPEAVPCHPPSLRLSSPIMLWFWEGLPQLGWGRPPTLPPQGPLIPDSAPIWGMEVGVGEGGTRAGGGVLRDGGPHPLILSLALQGGFLLRSLIFFPSLPN